GVGGGGGGGLAGRVEGGGRQQDRPAFARRFRCGRRLGRGLAVGNGGRTFIDRRQANGDVLIGLEDAAVGELELRGDAQLLGGRPDLPRQVQYVTGRQQSAAPGTAQLLRRNLPRRQGALDTFRRDFLRLNEELARC